jgi:hypothetical protein
MFTSAKKLCNPSIVEWHEAALFGREHFEYCFHEWDAGRWDEATCARQFRKRGSSLPLDNAEKGFRVTFDNNRFVVRGQLNLDFVEDQDASEMLAQLREQVNRARLMIQHGHFGPREVININPNTV